MHWWQLLWFEIPALVDGVLVFVTIPWVLLVKR